MFQELQKRANKIGRSDLDQLFGWCEKQKITNIEDLLTAAYVADFSAKNNSVTSLLDYFLFGGRERDEAQNYARRNRSHNVDTASIGFLQDTLQLLFSLLTSTMILAKPNPVHESIVEFINNHKKTSIVTTNYDGCMDEAILQAGISINTSMSELNEIDSRENSVELIKMHGSINWSSCDSCQQVRDFNLLQLKQLYEADELSYPVVGICKNCGGMRRPLLVPPLSFKFLMFPNLVKMWNAARQNIEDADYIVVIGFSFAEADTYINKIIYRSMSMNQNQKMIVVDTNHTVAETLRSRFVARIDSFDKDRVLSANEDAATIVPEILQSFLGKLAERDVKRVIPSTKRNSRSKIARSNKRSHDQRGVTEDVVME